MQHPSPIDPDYYIGTVTLVNAAQIQFNLPFATAKPQNRSSAKGSVGDFVFIDSGHFKLLGRITEVKIPEGERLSVEPKLGQDATTNPIGKISLLATVVQGKTKLERGLKGYPRIGDGVYFATSDLLTSMIANSTQKEGEIALAIGAVEAAGNHVEICLPPEKLFGRHCGIFGSTGGGKSWTIARLIEEIKAKQGKAIILDPTGEFANIAAVDQVLTFGQANGEQRQVYFPYQKMTEDDLFCLFRPSGQTQGPKLREAVKSLKLQKALGHNQCYVKQNMPRTSFFGSLEKNASKVHNTNCDFEISLLPEQIMHECVWDTARNDVTRFGDFDGNARAYCESLVSRIRALIHSNELSCLFQTQGSDITGAVSSFLNEQSKHILCISFQDVRFEHNTREILLDIIGRYLLGMARQGSFKDNPLILFLDEAHQFLGKTIGDEFTNAKLDAFGLIAKEGRKYGLTSVLATQRPRDIPQDVLSQLTTMFIHSLTNDDDRRTVERACGELDYSLMSFIPALSPGEAIVIGPDLPTAIPIRIKTPSPQSRPESKGPNYQAIWGKQKIIPTPPPVQPPKNQSTLAYDMLDDEIPF